MSDLIEAKAALDRVLQMSQSLYNHQVPEGVDEDDYTDGFMAAFGQMTEIINSELSLLRAGATTAHRVSWTIHNGPIPDSLYVLHKCDNPPCSNPDHLFLGTHLENIADMVAKGRHVGARRAAS
jgi:hypothetical protein